jgi:hypothetical protein
MAEPKSEIFKGTLPYGPDLARLDMQFPDLKPPDAIEYSGIGKIIKAEWPSPRFMGVLTAWRKRLERMRGLHTACDPGKALLIRTAEEAMHDNETDFRHKGRQIGRISRKSLRIDRDELPDEDTKKRLDFQRIVYARSAATFMTDNRELAKTWAAPKSLPKPHLVKPKDEK